MAGTSDWYRTFARFEAAGSSPRYEAICDAIAEDDDILDALRRLPPAKRQPNLLLAACRFVGAELDDVGHALDFVRSQWDEVAAVMAVRSTQTNEAARTATFLPLLSQIEGPISLIEVGASAGLCLYPDRYRITYRGHPAIGPPDSPVRFEVAVDGPMRLPTTPIEVVSRTGVDLNPLDVRRGDDLDWLRACIWPEHDARRARLDAAAGVVAGDPPTILRGDLNATIDDLLAEVPAGSTPVVFHSAVLAYLDPQARAALGATVRAHPTAVWISNEGPGVVAGLEHALAPPPSARVSAFFVVGVDGERVAAISDPHGAWLRWA